jgi:hypothetical protein
VSEAAAAGEGTSSNCICPRRLHGKVEPQRVQGKEELSAAAGKAELSAAAYTGGTEM